MCASGVSPGPQSKQERKVGSQCRKGPTRRGGISNSCQFTNTSVLRRYRAWSWYRAGLHHERKTRLNTGPLHKSYLTHDIRPRHREVNFPLHAALQSALNPCLRLALHSQPCSRCSSLPLLLALTAPLSADRPLVCLPLHPHLLPLCYNPQFPAVESCSSWTSAPASLIWSPHLLLCPSSMLGLASTARAPGTTLSNLLPSKSNVQFWVVNTRSTQKDAPSKHTSQSILWHTTLPTHTTHSGEATGPCTEKYRFSEQADRHLKPQGRTWALFMQVSVWEEAILASHLQHWKLAKTTLLENVVDLQYGHF